MAGETASPEIMGVSLAASPGVLPLGTGTVDLKKYSRRQKAEGSRAEGRRLQAKRIKGFAVTLRQAQGGDAQRSTERSRGSTERSPNVRSPNGFNN